MHTFQFGDDGNYPPGSTVTTNPPGYPTGTVSVKNKDGSTTIIYPKKNNTTLVGDARYFVGGAFTYHPIISLLALGGIGYFGYKLISKGR